MAAVASGLRCGQIAVDVHELRARQMGLAVASLAPVLRLREVVPHIEDHQRWIVESLRNVVRRDERMGHGASRW
jgi:hypothetical protein